MLRVSARRPFTAHEVRFARAIGSVLESRFRAILNPQLMVERAGLFRGSIEDRYVGVVRHDHPLAKIAVTPEDYAAWSHVLTWRPGLDLGQIDQSLLGLGIERNVMATVDGFAAALALARASDLVATVPEKHTAALRNGMHTFPIPLHTPEFTVSLLWHPRLDGDAAHRWLRNCIREACQCIN